MVSVKHNSLKLDIFFNPIFIPGFSGSGSRVQGPGPESRVRVQSPGPGSGSGSRVQGPGSRVRVRVQVLEVPKLFNYFQKHPPEVFHEESHSQTFCDIHRKTPVQGSIF